MRNDVTKEEFLEKVAIYESEKISRKELCSFFLCSTVGLNSLYRKFGVLKKQRGHKKSYPFNENFFSKIDSEASAYFLGFIMADGCVYIGKKNDHTLSIQLQKSDDEIIYNFIKQIEINKEPTYRNNVVSFKVFSRTLVNDLIKLKCTPRKSLTLEFPNISNGMLHHFIRGYFDGNGSICGGRRGIKNPFFWIKTAFYSSDFFAEVLSGKLSEAGFKNKVNKRGKISETLIWGFKNAEKFKEFLYSDSTLFLKRKRFKFDELRKTSPRYRNKA